MSTNIVNTVNYSFLKFLYRDSDFLLIQDNITLACHFDERQYLSLIGKVE